MTQMTKADFPSAYEAGRDCALNGATTANCHFSWFASPEQTAEWQRGKEDAEQQTER